MGNDNNKNIKELTSDNLIQDFLYNKNNQCNIKNLSSILYDELNNLEHYKKPSDNNKIKNIELKKRDSLGTMVNDTIDTQHKNNISLCAINTAYAIFLKLIAHQVICKSNKLNTETKKELINFLKELEENKLFRENNINNLVDNDGYDWYIQSIKHNNELYISLTQIIKTLNTYKVANKTYATDVFKKFYETYIGFNIRHSLGEYFTPLWLADYCLEEYENSIKKRNYNYKLIDNCCGSGSFILSAINRKIKQGLNYNEIINSVVGIDINPLSALQCRINYCIAIQSHINNSNVNTPIHIPVYWADSLNLKNNEKLKLKNQFDLVVGNPPWVKWGDLPTQYRNNLKDKANQYNLFSQNKFLGGNSLNICSLISYISLNDYGKHDSKLVYIMPSDMMFQPSYEAWRELNQDQFFEKYIKFKNKDIFKDVAMDFAIYMISQLKPSNIDYNEIKIKRNKIEWDDIKTFDEIKNNPRIQIENCCSKHLVSVRQDKSKFIITESEHEKQLFKIIGGQSVYKVRSGLGLLPKETRLFRIKSIDYKNKIASIESLRSVNNNLNKVVTINSDYLFPLIISQDLNETNIDLSNKTNYEHYTFLPYDYDQQSKHSFDQYELPYKLGQDFYNNFILKENNKLSNQSQSNKQLKQINSYGIPRIGHYTYHPNKIILRDNTQFVAHAITKDSFYNEKIEKRVPLLNSHVSSISERIIHHSKKPKTVFITQNEVLFVNAILNLNIVKQFVEKSNSTRGFELNDLGIYIPKLDQNNNYHKTILKQSYNSNPDWNSIYNNYIKDCLLNNPYNI